MMQAVNNLLPLFHPLPRYTSYPPATYWNILNSIGYEDAIQKIEKEPLSLYFHIPFCDKRCLFCGCLTIPLKNEKIKESYVSYLKKEIVLFRKLLRSPSEVVQIHFGGGTPTSLNFELLSSLIEFTRSQFYFVDKIEMAIEIDPRTIHCPNDLQLLRKMGFNRISLGVQDFDPQVQNSIGRIQPKELIEKVFLWARDSFFDSINIDLIYGLPFQTIASFDQTLDTLLTMKPDRIALFSFAYVPQIRSHQNNLPIDRLPSLEEKIQIFYNAKERLEKEGYLSIGIDHFVKIQDSLAQAHLNQKLTRNFQGYDLGISSSLIGFGLSAISSLKEGYFQNTKDLDFYKKSIENDRLPITQGLILSDDDKIRQWVIHKIMCGYLLDKKSFFKKFSCDFDGYFQKEIDELNKTLHSSLFINSDESFDSTTLGKFFLRNLAHIFDAYQVKSGVIASA